MSKNRMIALRIAGSVVGLLVVGVTVGVAIFFCLPLAWPVTGGDTWFAARVVLGALGGVVLGTVGAAVGATVTQRWLRQRSSFWIALWWAVAGLMVGVVVGVPCGLILLFYLTGGRQSGSTASVLAASLTTLTIALATMVAGTVIGSGWKAKPRDAASPSS